MKKIINVALAAALLATSSISAFAAAPSAYDGQSYESLGYTSDDPDSQFNLAVIANGDVKIVGDSMYIKGSVYSNGNIYVGDGQGNKIDGLFISGTEGSVDTDDANGLSHTCEGYIHVNDNGTRDNITYYSTKPEYAGAVKDTDTSFECTYEAFEAPEIANDLGDVEMTVYYNEVWKWSQEKGSYSEPGPNAPQTITEDTHIGTLTMNGSQDNWRNLDSAMIIDTTNGDINIVIDKLGDIINPSIKVIGDHAANIYIMDASYINNLAVNYDLKNNTEIGNSANTNIYIKSNDKVTFDNGYIMANTITVDASELQVSGAAKVFGDITSNASAFTITGGTTEVTGTVCVPNADSKVVDSGTLYGQLHTNTLTNNGAGRIIYKADTAVGKAEPTEAPTAEPTVEPTEEPTVEPTDEPSGNPAACVEYNLRTGEMTPGFMDVKNNRPHSWATGTDNNDDAIVDGFDDVWYTVLDEKTFVANNDYIPEHIREAAKNVAAKTSARLAMLPDATQLEYGRIDSQAWKQSYISRNSQGTLWMTPFITAQLENLGVTRDRYIWLAMGDTQGNITTVWVMDREMAGLTRNLNNNEEDVEETGSVTID